MPAGPVGPAAPRSRARGAVGPAPFRQPQRRAEATHSWVGQPSAGQPNAGQVCFQTRPSPGRSRGSRHRPRDAAHRSGDRLSASAPRPSPKWRTAGRLTIVDDQSPQRCHARTSAWITRWGGPGWSRHLGSRDETQRRPPGWQAASAPGHLQRPTVRIHSGGPPPFFGDQIVAHGHLNGRVAFVNGV